jgi:hypothetical protein
MRFHREMLVTLVGWSRTRGPQWLYSLAILCLLSIGATMSACGDGSSGNNGGGTQAGSYDLTVTGTISHGSIVLAHKTNLIWVVQ